jgi:hypothetical protein
MSAKLATARSSDSVVVATRESLARLIELAEGYPYFLQLYASEARVTAGRREESFVEVTAADVRTAEPEVKRQLDVGLYSSRYDKLGPNQREYVYARGSDASQVDANGAFG